MIARKFFLLVMITLLSAHAVAARDYQAVVDQAYERYKDLKEGANANYIPILDTVPSDLFGVVIATRDGKIYSAGETKYEFSIHVLDGRIQWSLAAGTHEDREKWIAAAESLGRSRPKAERRAFST